MIPSPSELSRLLADLKGRRVARVLIAYLVIGFAVLQVGELLVEVYRLPGTVLTFLGAVVGLGLPVALILAWAVGVIPSGDRPAPWADAAAPSPGSDDRSIAVLPFANLGEGSEAEYFTEGVTDDIITQLSKIGSLKVISRTSSMQYRAREKSLREIGRELGVATILEGSVRRAGDRVRITAQLVDSRTDRHIWAERYDRDLADIFSIQSDVALQIARALEAELVSDERRRIERPATRDVEAYNLYLVGWHHWNRFTVQGIHRAIEYFERAIARDPGYALPHSGLAHAYAMLGSHFGDRPPLEVWPKGKEAALRAMELDPSLAEAPTALGVLTFWYEWDGETAERHLRRGIELNPSSAVAHDHYGVFLFLAARYDEACSEIRRALELDPLSPVMYLDLGAAHHRAGRFEAAEQMFWRALELDPQFAGARWELGCLYGRAGRHREAVQELAAAVEASGGNPSMRASLASARAAAGERGQAEKTLAELEAGSQERYLPPYARALLHFAAGDRREALRWLEKGREEHAGDPVFMTGEPGFDRMTSVPELVPVLRAMRLDRAMERAAPEPA